MRSRRIPFAVASLAKSRAADRAASSFAEPDGVGRERDFIRHTVGIFQDSGKRECCTQRLAYRGKISRATAIERNAG